MCRIGTVVATDNNKKVGRRAVSDVHGVDKDQRLLPAHNMLVLPASQPAKVHRPKVLQPKRPQPAAPELMVETAVHARRKKVENHSSVANKAKAGIITTI